MNPSKILKKIIAAILCCNPDDLDEGYIPTPPNYAKPTLSAVKTTSRASASSYNTARSHLTTQASTASRNSGLSNASSASGSSIYYTASEGSDWGSRLAISRQSSGARSSEQYSLGNVTPRSSAVLSYTSSSASAASDRKFWADRARQSSGIFGESPEKKMRFNMAEMAFWNDDKHSGWKTARSSTGSSSAPRVMIPRGVSSTGSDFGARSNRYRSQRSSTASSGTGRPQVLSAWNSDSPMFL